MVFFELRWNYSPLKEKAVLLPDGLFIVSGRFATNRLRFFIDVKRNLLLMRAARRVIGLAAFLFRKIYGFAQTAGAFCCLGKSDTASPIRSNNQS
jgi:hypothetical protein